MLLASNAKEVAPRMKANQPASELEGISEAECWELLGRHRMGRIAIVVDAKPQIFPVNHGLTGQVIVFRTAAGTKLAHAPRVYPAAPGDKLHRMAVDPTAISGRRFRADARHP